MRNSQTQSDDQPTAEDATTLLDPKAKTDLPKAKNPRTKVLWLLCALVGHTCWALFPGITRYLQTESKMDAFLIIAMSLLLAALLSGPPILYVFGIRSTFSLKRMWLYITINFLLETTFMYSTRFTLSVYVQLIVLSVAFIVAFMSKILLKQKLPPYTIPAIVLSVFGGILVLVGELVEFGTVQLDATDALGMSLAFVTAISLASHFIFVSQVGDSISTWQLMWLYNFWCGILALPLSYALDDWSVISTLGATDWGLMVFFSLGLFVFGNIFMILPVRYLGASLPGTLLPWRLVVAVLFGVFVLNEPVETLDIIGIVIVVLTLLFFLFCQYWVERKKEKEKTQQLSNVASSSFWFNNYS